MNCSEARTRTSAAVKVGSSSVVLWSRGRPRGPNDRAKPVGTSARCHRVWAERPHGRDSAGSATNSPPMLTDDGERGRRSPLASARVGRNDGHVRPPLPPPPPRPERAAMVLQGARQRCEQRWLRQAPPTATAGVIRDSGRTSSPLVPPLSPQRTVGGVGVRRRRRCDQRAAHRQTQRQQGRRVSPTATVGA